MVSVGENVNEKHDLLGAEEPKYSTPKRLPAPPVKGAASFEDRFETGVADDRVGQRRLVDEEHVVDQSANGAAQHRVPDLERVRLGR